MAECKRCLYFDICKMYADDVRGDYEDDCLFEDCLNFKNKDDFVEVVRCKDCKYFNGKIDVLCERCGDIDEPCGGCHYYGSCTYDDGYCHHGERRKEDG